MKNDARRLCFLCCLSATWTLLAMAQSAPIEPAQLQKVEVTGDAAQQARRNATGALVVLPREELLRHGDTRLADALRRVPGISVVGSGGRGMEIRMSGLGGGYTQLLLNGESVPPGFDLESLSPELIERVEISRSASVEQSNQAIAGSVNIVLRRTPSSAHRDIKLSMARQLGRPALSADAQFGDRQGALSWGLGAGLSTEKRAWPMSLDQHSLDASGAVTQAYTTDKFEYDRTDRLTLTPRATWTLAPKHSLSTDHLLQAFHSQGGAIDRRDSEVGALPQFAYDDLWLDIHGWLLRSRVNWTLTQADDTKWEIKLGLTQQTRDSKAGFTGYNFDERLIRDAKVDSLAIDRGLTASGRMRTPWRETHSISLGWDAEQNSRSEDRLQREQELPGGLPVENLDEIYDARVRRLALFAQDEWELSRAWMATLGLRWEGLQTLSEGNVFDAVSSRSSVFSPVLQTVWRVPGGKDQVRLALARSYKPPNPRQLMPRRFVANNNSANTPNFQGNPDLRPELAWGLDASWERPLAKSSQVGISAYLKRIDQVVVEELFQQDGAWVLRRANHGVAWVQGMALEAKLSLRELWPVAPALDLRANLGVNRSRVEAVPGPDNRLADQTPLSLNLGVDHRVESWSLSWGASFNYQAGGPQRASSTRFGDRPTTRMLDCYAAWKPDTRTQWRLALNNLLHPDRVDISRVLDAGDQYLLTDRWRTGTSVRLTLEKSL